MENDLSKKTIVLLVVLTLLISVLGTWAVLSKVAVYQNTKVIHKDEGPSSASVSLGILDKIFKHKAEEPKPDTEIAVASINIQNA